MWCMGPLRRCTEHERICILHNVKGMLLHLLSGPGVIGRGGRGVKGHERYPLGKKEVSQTGLVHIALLQTVQ